MSLHAAIAECQHCKCPLPTEVPVCKCGTLRVVDGALKHSDRTPEHLQKRLLQLRDGIGWWESGDGRTCIARAGYLLLKVYWQQSQCRTLVVDEHAGLVVLDLMGCTLPVTAKHIAVESAAAYAVEQLGVRLPLGRLADMPPLKAQRLVLAAQGAQGPLQLLEGEILVHAVGNARYYPWSEVKAGAVGIAVPHPRESLRQLQTNVATSAAFHRKSRDPEAFFTVRIDEARQCVILKVKTEDTAGPRVKQRTYPWRLMLKGEPQFLKPGADEELEELETKVRNNVGTYAKAHDIVGQIGVRLDREEGGVWIFLKKNTKIN